MNARNIAQPLSSRNEKDFSRKKCIKFDCKIREGRGGCPVEEILGGYWEDGGNLFDQKQRGQNVDVLFIQTKEMVEHLGKVNLNVFQCDTTFTTSSEGKLYIQVNYSNFTAKWKRKFKLGRIFSGHLSLIWLVQTRWYFYVI